MENEALFKSYVNDCHIFLIDQDNEFLSWTTRILRFIGYKVTTAASESEAVSLLSDGSKKFDLVLADDKLPLLLQTIHMGIPIILTSTNPDDAKIVLALRSGACFYLSKPIDVYDLKNLWQHIMKDREIKRNISLWENKTNGLEKKFEDKGNDKTNYENYSKCNEKFLGKSAMAFYRPGTGECSSMDIIYPVEEPTIPGYQVAKYIQECAGGFFCDRETTKHVPEFRSDDVGVKRNCEMEPFGNNFDDFKDLGPVSPDLSVASNVAPWTGSSNVTPYETSNLNAHLHQNGIFGSDETFIFNQENAISNELSSSNILQQPKEKQTTPETYGQTSMGSNFDDFGSSLWLGKTPYNVEENGDFWPEPLIFNQPQNNGDEL